MNNTTQINDEFTGYTNLTINGSGTLILANPNDYMGNPYDYIGTATINSAVVQLNNSLSLQNATVIVNSANGLAFNAGLGNPYPGGPATDTAYLGGLGGTGNLTLADNSSPTPQPVNLVIGSTGVSTEFDGVVSGPGSLTITGGTLTLTGNNTYSGGTVLAGGTVALDPAMSGNTVLGTGPVTVLDSSTVRVGGAVVEPDGRRFVDRILARPATARSTSSAPTLPLAPR